MICKQNALFPCSACLEEKLVGSGMLLHRHRLEEDLVKIINVNDRNRKWHFMRAGWFAVFIRYPIILHNISSESQDVSSFLYFGYFCSSFSDKSDIHTTTL
jgi:hypothetical protein